MCHWDALNKLFSFFICYLIVCAPFTSPVNLLLTQSVSLVMFLQLPPCPYGGEDLVRSCPQDPLEAHFLVPGGGVEELHIMIALIRVC